MIYLDYAAATPPDDSVLDTFYQVTKKYYANPNSSHKLGLDSKKLMDDTTLEISNLFHVSEEEIIYTSGASEANNLAIKGVAERYKNRGKHILISALEHNSIVASATYLMENGYEVEIIPVTHDGYIDITSLKQMLRSDTILVSITSVDSELGIKQPIEEISLLLKDYPNCIFHTDSSQAFGKVNINYQNVDLVTITPHKFYGLQGIGILIKKKEISLKPQIHGGKSVSVFRSGTPDLASIVAAGIAIKKALANVEERYNYVLALNEKIKDSLKNYPKIHINSTVNSIPYTINFSIKGVKALDIQNKLEKKGIFVSTNTSCCPIMTPSKIVYALTKDKGLSSSSIRVSLSHLTTLEEVDSFLNSIDDIYKEYEANGKI